MKGARAFLYCIMIVGTVFAADRFTKYLVDEFIPVGDAIPGTDSFIKLFHTLNDGMAFSLFQGHRAPLVVMQSILVVVIVIMMFVVHRRLAGTPRHLTVMTAFSLMLGGGLGNLWDRVATGFVTDFVSIGGFAVFNVADACLVAGCGLLALYMLVSVGSSKNEDGRESSEDGAKEGDEK